MNVNKKSLSETDICTQFITPAIQQAGWDFPTQVRQDYSFTAGQIIVKVIHKLQSVNYDLAVKPVRTLLSGSFSILVQDQIIQEGTTIV